MQGEPGRPVCSVQGDPRRTVCIMQGDPGRPVCVGQGDPRRPVCIVQVNTCIKTHISVMQCDQRRLMTVFVLCRVTKEDL